MSVKRVAVAMSGGVDSAVAALLMTQAGYDVIGITLKLYCYGENEATERSCCSLSSIQDARRTCDVIGIPHYVLNFEERFTERVIDNFVDDYVNGRTPNPCVLCNQHVKFSALLDKARGLGAEWVATGHYAQLAQSDAGPVLARGVDPSKDQSYALWAVPRDVLYHTILPVGEFTKDEIRRLADEGNLPVAHKVESQDICFVPDGDYASFVSKRIAGSDSKPITALTPGEIVDVDGQIVGRHPGIAHFTIGQRRGIGVSAPHPLFVTNLDAATNRVTVGPRSELASIGFLGNHVNWVSPEPTGSRQATVKIRYRHSGSAAVVETRADGSVGVTFRDPEDAVTPGQSAVFYDGDTVLGGAVISERVAV